MRSVLGRRPAVRPPGPDDRAGDVDPLRRSGRAAPRRSRPGSRAPFDDDDLGGMAVDAALSVSPGAKQAAMAAEAARRAGGAEGAGAPAASADSASGAAAASAAE